MRSALRLLLFSLTLILLSAPYLWTADEGLRILSPANSSVVKHERIRVLGIAKDPGIKNVACQVKGGEAPGNAAVRAGGAFIIAVQLKPGLNEITVSDQGGKFSQKISVFFSKDNSKPPDGFRRYYTHYQWNKEDQCQDCHDLKGERPDYAKIVPSTTCITEQCHSRMGKDKFVHGPVGSGTCTACHNPHGSPNKNLVTRPGGEGCYICHEAAREKFKGKIVHPPITGGDCVGCHDPHQSSMKFQLKGGSAQGLCFTCHDASLLNHSNLHTPVKEGCTECHQPHVSDNSKLLIAPPEKICLKCHSDMEKGLSKKHVHKPVAQNCEICHDAHGSPNKVQLRKDPVTLCNECHGGTNAMKSIADAKYGHSPVQKGDCGDCHVVHYSDYDKLLKASLKQICFKCHKELGEKVKNNKFPHGPVSTDDCAACHQTHGSPYPKILKNAFPSDFYVPYKAENYAICFECHNKDIALKPETTDLTNFRNGDRNLHFVHVNKQKKGRSCKACHEVHAGSQQKHIREEVPFGNNWSYPIRYTQTATGGTCVVGCHKTFTYDREKPVSY